MVLHTERRQREQNGQKNRLYANCLPPDPGQLLPAPEDDAELRDGERILQVYCEAKDLAHILQGGRGRLHPTAR